MEGGAEIDGAGDGLHLRAGGDLSRPAYKERRAHAAFVGGRLSAFHAARPAVAIRAVVREVDDDGIVLEVQFLEFGEDAADVAVLVLEHGLRAARFV